MVPGVPLDDTNTYSLFSVAPPPVEKKNALMTFSSWYRITAPGSSAMSRSLAARSPSRPR